MERRTLAVLLVGVMIVLAGCHYPGDPDRDPPDIVNEQDLKTGVSPGEPATVKADVPDSGDVDTVNLTYDVYDRSGDLHDTGTEPMTEDGNVFKGTVPGYPAGYEVEYKVKVTYDDGEETSTSSSYTVSYISAIQGPSDGDIALDSTTKIGVELETAADVKEVTLHYERHFRNQGQTVTDETTRTVTGNDTDYEFDIQNSRVGETNNVSVTYHVVVTYGNGTEKTFSSKEFSYEYRDSRKSILVVPVTYKNNTSDVNLTEITDRFNKTVEYYDVESNGDVTLTYKVLKNNSQQPYFVLPNDTTYYYNSSKKDPYLRRNIRDDANAKIVEKYGDSVDDGYRSIVYVHTNIDPHGKSRGISFTWMQEVVVSWNDEYGTYAHELGHSMFNWGDYYNASEEGEIGPWGLMGSGGNLDDYAGQITAYHKYKEGWISQHTLDHPTEDDPSTRFVPYMKNHDHPNERMVKYDLDGNPMFDHYVFEARNPPNTALPSQNDWAYSSGDGIVMYGINETDAERDYMNVVRNAKRDSENTVPLRSGANDTIHDPDAGIEVRAETASANGSVVNVTRGNYTNLSGVNVFKRVECEEIENSTLCNRLNASAERGNVTLVKARAVTDRGVVGMTANGTVVNNVSGAYQIYSGTIQKLFVPDNRSASFVVDTSELEGTGANVTVVTQTVTRDEDGDRIASGYRKETVEGGESVEPELARLNISRASWDAGDFRTLENATLTTRVENNGIADLNNVSVSTNVSWVTVNRSTYGTIDEANSSGLAVNVDVPGGKPVGNYTINVTARGEGTKVNQTDTLQVEVTVLPTVRWNATPDVVAGTIATNDTVVATVTVRNEPSSNVALRDVETSITGDVTKFAVDAPRFVESVAPGANVTLTTTISVPDDGIAEGTYLGEITVDTPDDYQDRYEYPVPIPDDYVAPEPTEHGTAVRVDAYGPSVNSSAEFHPEKQVAMRKGAATQRVTVEPVDSQFDVPAEGITARATIPDGWRFQSSRASSPDESDVKVWIVEETASDTPGGQSGTRHKLDPIDYSLTVENGKVVLDIADLRNTSFGQYMTDDHVLEFEFKLNKKPRAAEYEYRSEVVAATRSPIDVYRFEQPAAVVDVFDPREGTPAEQVSNERSRVARDTVRADTTSLGTNATLRDPTKRLVKIDGERTWWMEFELVSDDAERNKSVWIPLGAEAAVEDEYVVVDAVLTRQVGQSAVGALQSGEAIELELPATPNASSEELLLIDGATIDSTENGSVVLRTLNGTSVAEMNATTSDDRGDARVSVVVGEGLFEADLTEQGSGIPITVGEEEDE